MLIDVHYSSLNYKDGLSATGNPGVTRNFPHTPGIDAAGIVIQSSDQRVLVGEEVIVIGFDLGMNTSGGFAQRIRVPAEWVVKMPAGLSLHSSMILGTAGFTAAECIDKLERAGMTPSSGPVLVTGATRRSGFGGRQACSLIWVIKLPQLPANLTNTIFCGPWVQLKLLLERMWPRAQIKPLLAERWGGVVDTVRR